MLGHDDIGDRVYHSKDHLYLVKLIGDQQKKGSFSLRQTVDILSKHFDKISGKITSTSVCVILCIALLCVSIVDSIYNGEIAIKDDKLVIIIAVFEIKGGEIWSTNYENGMEIVYVTENHTIVYAWAIDFGFLIN